jgi:sulfatase modifying factor 1
MKKARMIIYLVDVCMMAVANFASADTIRGINIDFVNIGHPGNVPDTQVMNDGTTGYGTVGYTYRIGTYDVTNAQWNTFVAVAGAPTGTDGGYGSTSSSTGDQQPTNWVSWYEAAQFCNYLTSGDKSKGAYQFSGNNANPGNFLGIDRVSSISTYGTSYVIPTEDEWYKAAYFKADGSGYSIYAFGTNTAPIAGLQSNYVGIIGYPWNVGSGAMEQNGTYDMMGNVWQWNESLINASAYVFRGGFYNSFYDYELGSSERFYGGLPSGEGDNLGFRIVSIPEPTSLSLLAIGGLALLRKRKA